jgi:hypothetical protein
MHAWALEMLQVMLNGVAVDGTPVLSSAPLSAGQRNAKKAPGVGVVAPARRLRLQQQQVLGKRQAAVPAKVSAQEPACKKLRGACPESARETLRVVVGLDRL